MIKRFLFVCLTLLFFISVPYEVSAAPKKETRKERRERRKREQKSKKKQQRNNQYSNSLEECLEKSQLPEKEKSFLADAIKEIKNTAIGKKIIRLMNGKFDFKFAFKDMQEYTWGTYGSGYISLNSKFLTYKTPARKADISVRSLAPLPYIIDYSKYIP